LRAHPLNNSYQIGNPRGTFLSMFLTHAVQSRIQSHAGGVQLCRVLLIVACVEYNIGKIQVNRYKDNNVPSGGSLFLLFFYSFFLELERLKSNFTMRNQDEPNRDVHHPRKKRGQIESAGKSRQRVGGASPPHGKG
jgi:hypothetical protein